MKPTSISEIKQELQVITPARLLDLCVRLAKYKKENKELLSYLLFEAHDEPAYISSVKSEIDDQFAMINLSNLYFAKKSLRKILRMAGKYIRQTGSKITEVELRLYFCVKMKSSGIPIRRNNVINNLYQSQLKKIAVIIATLHEDLQYDYLKELTKLY